MTDHEAFMAAIRAKPRDDLPRLVYADYLDEHGEPERAEFIRVQCELAGIDPHKPCGGYYCQTYDTGNVLHVDCRGERLRNRERALWAGDGPPRWFDPHEHAPGNAALREREVELWKVVGESFDLRGPSRHFRGLESRLPWEGGIERENNICIVSRGFVSAVRCRLADWLGGVCEGCYGAEVHGWAGHGNWRVSECPVCHGTGRTPGVGPAVVRAPVVVLRRVTLSDREPSTTTGGRTRHVWRSESVIGMTPEMSGLYMDVLPADLMPNRRHTFNAYQTRAGAINRLSARLIRWAWEADPAATPEPSAAR